MQAASDQLTLFPDALPKWFQDWLRTKHGEEVARRFITKTCQLLAAGRTHFGSKSIVESIRFDEALTNPGATFKVNNNMTPWLSRYAEHVLGERLPQGFFEKREIRKEIPFHG